MVDGIGSSLSGLVNSMARMTSAAGNISKASVPGKNPPVDLATEAVDMKIASIQYKANAKALKAQLDTEKEIINILA